MEEKASALRCTHANTGRVMEESKTNKKTAGISAEIKKQNGKDKI